MNCDMKFYKLSQQAEQCIMFIVPIIIVALKKIPLLSIPIPIPIPPTQDTFSPLFFQFNIKNITK